MDEQNLETKLATNNSHLNIPVPVPKKPRHYKISGLALVLLVGAILSGSWWLWGVRHSVSPVSGTPLDVSPAHLLSQDNEQKVLPPGFPADLDFEYGATVTADQVTYAPDNKSETVERAYQSKRSVEVNYRMAQALQKNGWQITVVADKSASGQKTFKAQKDPYSATVSITPTSATTSLVRIISTLKF